MASLTTNRPTGYEGVPVALFKSIDSDDKALEALGLDGFAWPKLSVRLQGKKRMFLKAFETFDRRFQEETAGMTDYRKRNFDGYCCNVFPIFNRDYQYSREILDCPECALIAAKFGIWNKGFKLSIQNGSKELALVVLRAIRGKMLDVVDVYEQMAEDLKGDEELALIALSCWSSSSPGEIFNKMSAELQGRENLQRVVIFYLGASKYESRFALKLVPESSPYKCVKEKVLEAVRYLSENFTHVSKELRGDPEVIQAAIRVDNFRNMTAGVIEAAMGTRHFEWGTLADAFLKIVKSIDAEGFLAAGGGEKNGALLEEWRTIGQSQVDKRRIEWEEAEHDYY